MLIIIPLCFFLPNLGCLVTKKIQFSYCVPSCFQRFSWEKMSWFFHWFISQFLNYLDLSENPISFCVSFKKMSRWNLMNMLSMFQKIKVCVDPVFRLMLFSLDGELDFYLKMILFIKKYLGLVWRDNFGMDKFWIFWRL